MTVLGLRERKKTATRQAIADAALQLALELGPERVTVDAISAAADVSPRTFFNYFPTKDDAILDIGEDLLPTLRPLLRERPADEPAFLAFRAAVLESSSYSEERALGRARRAELIARHPHLQARSALGYAQRERVLAELLADRLGLDPDRDMLPTVMAAAGLAAIRTATAHWYAHPGGAPLTERLAEAFDDLAVGLAR